LTTSSGTNGPIAPGAADAAALAATALLLGLLLFVRFEQHTAWQRVAVDAAHVPIFAMLAALGASRLGRHRPHWPAGRRDLTVFLATQLAGVAVEFLQSLSGRPASLFDLGSNAAGAAIGLALHAAWQRSAAPAPARSRAAAWLLGAAAAVGLVYAAWHPVSAALAYCDRAARLPALAAFDSRRGLYFVEARGLDTAVAPLPAALARAPRERALAIAYDPVHPPQLELREPWPDWRGRDALVLELAHQGDAELELVLRVLDAGHDWSVEDRLNLPAAVPAGGRVTLRVPLGTLREAPAGREMDLERIANLLLFSPSPGGRGTLWVIRASLE
jgi:hypothetical protein